MNNIPNTFKKHEENVLLAAIQDASEIYYGYQDVDRYLEETPKASFVVEVNQNLNRLGYKITKI